MGAKSNNAVLGFMLDDTAAVPNAPPRPTPPENPLETDFEQSRIVKRAERLLDTITGARDKFVVSAFEADVCHLPVKGYGVTEFDMSPERIEAIIKGGFSAATEYFEQHAS